MRVYLNAFQKDAYHKLLWSSCVKRESVFCLFCSLTAGTVTSRTGSLGLSVSRLRRVPVEERTGSPVAPMGALKVDMCAVMMVIVL